MSYPFRNINRINAQADRISKSVFPGEELDRLRSFFTTLVSHRDEDYLFKRMSSFFSLSIVTNLPEDAKSEFFQSVIEIIKQNREIDPFSPKWIDVK